MKDPRDYLVNYTDSSSGFSLGRLKDDPGDESGSGITVLTHNDFLYALLAPILKYKGAISETDESETASDFLDAIEIAMGLKASGVSEWSAATTYSTLGTVVSRKGMQFVNINNSGNTNKPPFEYPTYWLPVPESRMLYRAYAEGIIQPGTLSPLHVYGGAQYQTVFPLGTHRFGGAAGSLFTAYGIHLDGSTVVAGSTLATAVAAHWAKDIFAPEAVGVRTLKDARECVIRSMGASGGKAPTLAEVQADQFQGHRQDDNLSADSIFTSAWGFGGSGSGAYKSIQTTYTQPTSLNISIATGSGVVTTINGVVLDPITDGTNGTPRTGLETRGKSFVAGVPYVVALVPV